MDIHQPLHLSLFHLALSVTWDDPTVWSGLENTFSYFGVTPAASPADSALRYSIRSTAPPPLPDNAERLTDDEAIRFYRSGTDLHLRIQDAGLHIAPQAGMAMAYLPAHIERWEGLLYGLTFYGLVILLYSRGLHTMHTACLARDGRGCLFAGPSDSGKSTLAMNLIRRGWSYLSDDSIVLSDAGDAVEAFPLRRDFCMDPGAEVTYPEIDGHWQPHVTERTKYRVAIRSVYPEQAADRCRLRTIVFPQIVDRATSELVPLPSRAGLFELMQHSGALGLLDAATANRHLQLLNKLARHTRSYRLLAGRDVKADPAALARFEPYFLGEEMMDGCDA